ncbi:carboxymuconolactone decarboxylase family protein [Halomarina halobia]|uniref:Carboxymuconolactone decarboxylase family protein n=1 Tax=Halomarina halobia TaxID=3033386 RepID=A0ABD6A640_9EURY|nr:carboxymuconolactone decarboxylase family protein [Halomarina sp. PSR21]
MPSRIDTVAPEEAEDEAVGALLRDARDGWYGDAAFFGAMAHRPELFERIAAVFEAFPRSERIDAETLELMRLRVAAVNRCAYCATVRTRDVADDVASKEDAVLCGTADLDDLDDHEALAVRLADAFSSDPHGITDELIDDLRDEFGREGLVELLMFAALEVGFDRFCIALRLDTTEESEYPTGLRYPFDDDATTE